MPSEIDSIDDPDQRAAFVHDLAGTWFGDANWDTQFNSADFVEVFIVGEYEDATPFNSTWSEGDWDGDGDFTSADFIVAFQDGGCEQGPRTEAAVVPEPGAWALSLIGFVLWLVGCRTR